MKRFASPWLFRWRHQASAKAQATVGRGPPYAARPSACEVLIASCKRGAPAAAHRSLTLASVTRLAKRIGWASAHRRSTLAPVVRLAKRIGWALAHRSSTLASVRTPARWPKAINAIRIKPRQRRAHLQEAETSVRPAQRMGGAMPRPRWARAHPMRWRLVWARPVTAQPGKALAILLPLQEPPT